MATGIVAAVAAQLVVDGGVRRPGAGGLAELSIRSRCWKRWRRGVKAAAFTG